MKTILLTFDLEEFDSPKDFGSDINENEMFQTTRDGLDALLNLLKHYKIPATFFTTANFAKKYPKFLKEISKRHEIACHGYVHSDDYKEDISKIYPAKREIEKIIGKKINGFRAPRFQIKNISSLSNFRFEYDSSVHPTWIPGRYFNIFKSRKIHQEGNITEIPLSVLPLLRLPIFWLAFKNFPFIYSKVFTKANFLFSDYNMLVLHPWEFADISNTKLPKYMKSKSGDAMINLLEKYILFCKRNNYSFSTVADFLKI